MKYIIKFEKKDDVCFISHLDLQKVFLRVFRIIGIKPGYSNGYNPHPKMSFVLPLSLGFFSEAEYIEIETENDDGFDIDRVTDNLNKCLPKGLIVSYINKKPSHINKKIASYVNSAEYSVICPFFSNSIEMIVKYLELPRHDYDKTSRKTGRVRKIDLKPLIKKMSITDITSDNIQLSIQISAGNDTSVNPSIIIKNLYEFLGIDVDVDDLIITRKAMFLNIDGRIINADELFETRTPNTM